MILTVDGKTLHHRMTKAYPPHSTIACLDLRPPPRPPGLILGGAGGVAARTWQREGKTENKSATGRACRNIELGGSQGGARDAQGGGLAYGDISQTTPGYEKCVLAVQSFLHQQYPKTWSCIVCKREAGGECWERVFCESRLACVVAKCRGWRVGGMAGANVEIRALARPT